jgi:hypothetical protein
VKTTKKRTKRFHYQTTQNGKRVPKASILPSVSHFAQKYMCAEIKKEYEMMRERKKENTRLFISNTNHVLFPSNTHSLTAHFSSQHDKNKKMFYM